MSSKAALENDYDVFCTEWEADIRRMVASKNMFPLCDVDDIVQELMVSLYTKDYLSIYDSTKGARFSTFIYGFVSRSLLGKRDRYARKMWQEGISLTTQELAEPDSDGNILFSNTLKAASDNISVEFLDLVVSIYRELRKTPVTAAANDFPYLFSCIVKQLFFGLSPECISALGEVEMQKTGRYGVNRKALAYDLGISETGVSVMLTKLGELPAVRALLPNR